MYCGKCIRIWNKMYKIDALKWCLNFLLFHLWSLLWIWIENYGFCKTFALISCGDFMLTSIQTSAAMVLFWPRRTFSIEITEKSLVAKKKINTLKSRFVSICDNFIFYFYFLLLTTDAEKFGWKWNNLSFLFTYMFIYLNWELKENRGVF